MPALSNADQFYAQIPELEKEAFAFIQSLIGNSDAAENGWREYKGAAFIDKDPNWKEKVKRFWSCNLSAFANTGGGVLIWGLEEKDEVPCGLSLAPDCGTLHALLVGWVNGATDPFVPNVKVRAIKNPAHQSAGFVAALIPGSVWPPHRAEWEGQQYWIRNQHANIACPPALLRSLFHPRKLARVGAEVTINAAKQAGGGGLQLSVSATMRNLGPGTAEAVVIAFQTKVLQSVRVHGGPSWEAFGASNIVRCRFPLPPNFILPDAVTMGGVCSADLDLDILCFAHDTPVHYISIKATREELERSAVNRAPLGFNLNAQPVY